MNKRQKGVALVEFALILPFLLLLSMITTEFGRAMYQYNTLTKSVRDASRYLSLQTPGTKIAEARNLMVYGNTAGTGAPLALGLMIEHAVVLPPQTAGTNPVINTVTVRIEGYTFNSLFPSVFGISFGNIPFNPISATMRSYL
jgi:hypothetical protein